jgi:hypothetical protein
MRNPFLLALPFAVLFAACGDPELVGVHIALQKDGSGTLTTRSLVPATDAGPAEAATKGVTFEARANLCCSQGRFQHLADVRLADGEVHFALKAGDEMPGLRAFVKRGPDCKWVQALVPDLEARRAMAKVYDATGKTQEIGDAIRLEIAVPGLVVTSGVQPTGRGVEAAFERAKAYLVIPVRTAVERGDELIWDVSWR